MRIDRHSLSAKLFCGTALGLLSLTPVFAEEELYSLDPIVVSLRDEKAGAADRATAVYVSDAELESARMGDAKDLFSGIASVSVGGGIPLAQRIFVNGIDIVNMTTTVDGAMQNNRTFHHTSANVIDPGLLKFVRVDPGIAAADAGPNAVAGAVVMETIDAGDFLAEGENFGGNLRLSYEDNGENFGRALTLVGRHSGFEILAYGRAITGEDYTDGGGETRHGTAADMKSGLLKAAYESQTGHRFEISGQRIIDDALRPWRADLSGVIGGRPTPETRVYDTERNTYSLSYEFTQGSALWNPKFNLGYSESIVNVPEPYESESNANTLSARLENTFHVSDRGSVVAGIDYYDKQSDYDDPLAELLTGTLNENAQNIGFFAQGRFDVLEALSVSGGLRYDVQDFEGVNEFTDKFTGWSGNLSATYFVTQELSLRAGYSNVFGGLQLDDSYIFFGAGTGAWDYEDLKPSRSENYALGFDWFSQWGLTVGGEFFQTKINDARHIGEVNDIESKGFNLGAAYDWGEGSARLTYTNTDVRANGASEDSYILRGYGTPIGQLMVFQIQQAVPQWDMVFGGNIDVAFKEKARGSYADKDLKGYEVLDLFAEWSPAAFPALTVRGEINNLFDVEYADRGAYGADFSDTIATNEPGRSFRIEAVARF